MGYTPFRRRSIHEANMKQTYSKYTCTTCALSLLYRVNAVGTPVGTQRCRTIHRRFAALGPHHRHTRQFPLAESVRACTVQAGDNRLSLTERHGTVLPGCRPTTFVRHAVKTTSVVLTDTPAGCPPVAVRNCWWPSLRCRSCSAMEQVCQRTLSRPTHFHSSIMNRKYFCLDNLIHLYFCRDLCFYLWS